MSEGAVGGADAAGVGSARENSIRGIGFFLAAMTVFALQDGLSAYLASQYAPIFVVMIRYWALAALVLAISARRPGGLRAAARTRRPLLQILRGLLLAAEITLTIFIFAELGLAASHAIMAVYPLLVAAMAWAFLGERLDAVRWGAIGLGFLGVLVILRPGLEAIDPLALGALLGAAMFALYAILTRVASRDDPASVSFFYTGVAGAVGASLIGPFYAEPIALRDWPLMGALCLSGALCHFLLIKAYEATEAARLQPYAYWQLALATLIGVFAFGEPLLFWTVLGAGLIVLGGLIGAAQERRALRRDAGCGGV
ncbi:MAG: DMT family transporter [Pseudomonadota bacterium]